jgi:hypothetical protein
MTGVDIVNICGGSFLVGFILWWIIDSIRHDSKNCPVCRARFKELGIDYEDDDER